MRDLNGRLVIRVKGRQALTQRLTRLLMATHRYGRHRARTSDEVLWTARLLDRLQQALDEARR